MIKAVLKSGQVHPLEPLPNDWPEGKELWIDEQGDALDPQQADEWRREMEEGAAGIDDEDFNRFLAAIDEVERESKE